MFKFLLLLIAVILSLFVVIIDSESLESKILRELSNSSTSERNDHIEKVSQEMFVDIQRAIRPIDALIGQMSKQALSTVLTNAFLGRGSWLVCMLCLKVVHFIRLVNSLSLFKWMSTGICDRVFEPRMCTGLADLYGPELLFILKNSQLTSHEVCGLWVSATCMSSTSNYPDSSKWALHSGQFNLTPEVEKSLQASQQQPETEGQNVSMILHLSDIHLDPNYSLNSVAHCTEFLCCQSRSVPKTESIVRAGYWGSFGSCDTNQQQMDSLFTTITTAPIVSDYRFVVITGDYMGHRIWNISQEFIFLTTRRINSAIRNRIPGDKIVIPVIGNHESTPSDQFCPPEIDAKQFHMDWLYNELLDQWRDWIPESQHALFAKYGYYSLVDGRVRWVVLNMNYCNRLNFWVAYDYKELGGMLNWFEQELRDAVTSGQYVYITGHIVPDTRDCIDNWVVAYQRITEVYAPVIKGQFFGHTHKDEVRLFYNEREETTGVAYLSPSVTPFLDVHPSFRLYNTDPTTGDIVDHRTFFLNITEANEQHTRFGSLPEWKFLYSARSSYNLTSLTAEVWHNFVNDAQPEMIRKYYRHYGRYDANILDNTEDAAMRRMFDDRIRVNVTSSQQLTPRS